MTNATRALLTGDDPNAEATHAMDTTPAAWRVMAGTLLVVGAAVGRVVASRSTRRVAVASGAMGLMATASVLTGTYRARSTVCPARPRLSAHSFATLPRITIAIAARDEVTALPALIGDLGRQDHRSDDGSPAFDVVVVDDRSTDATGAAARLAADIAGLGDVTTIVRRPVGARPDGKGAALASIPDHIVRGSAVFVLDADARVDPGVVRRVATHVAVGDTTFTARRRVAGLHWSARMQDDEQTVDAFVQRARGALGGCPEFRGNGMVVTTAALRAVGGWGAGRLTEDLDLSTRFAIRGKPIRVADDVEVWEAPTASIPAFARQRIRWAEGSVRRFMELLPAAMASAELDPSAKADIAIAAAQLALPTVVLGTVLDGIWRRRPGPAVALVGAYLGTALAFLLMSQRDPVWRDGQAPSARRAVVTAVYLLHWLAAVPAALARIAFRPDPVVFAMTRVRRLPPP